MSTLATFVRSVFSLHDAPLEVHADGTIEALLPRDLQKVLGAGDEHVVLVPGHPAPGRIPYGYGTEALQGLLHLAVYGGRVAHCRADVAPPSPRPPRVEGINVSLGEARVRRETGATIIGFARYTAQGDDRRIGLVSAAVTLPQGDPIAVADLASLRPMPADGSTLDADALRRAVPALQPGLMREAAAALQPFREAVARRHRRDAQRVERYFQDVEADLRRRLASRPGPGLQAKLDQLPEEHRRRRAQLAANHALRVRLDLVSLTVLDAPCVIHTIEVRRRKHVRHIDLVYDAASRAWSTPVCDGCSEPAFPAFALCDEARHVLCASCWDACGDGGRRPCFVCDGGPSRVPWAVSSDDDLAVTDPLAYLNVGAAGKQPRQSPEPPRSRAPSPAATPPPTRRGAEEPAEGRRLEAKPSPAPLRSQPTPSRFAEEPAEGRRLEAQGTPHPPTDPASAVLALLETRGDWMTSGQIRKVVEIDAATLRRVLEPLVRDGRVQKTGQRRGTRYRIAPP